MKLLNTKEQDYLNHLLEATKIFKELDIPYFLVGGTLLALYRGQFIPWDLKDVDICIFYANWDIPTRHKIIAKAEKAGFYTRMVPNKIIQSVSQMRLDKGPIHTDIFIYYPSGDWTLHRWCTGKNKYIYYAEPAKYTNNLSTLTFKGHTFSVPSHTEDHLALYYGRDWKTPKVMSSIELEPIYKARYRDFLKGKFNEKKYLQEILEV